MPMTGSREARLSELADRLSLPSLLPTPALAFLFSISFLRYPLAGDMKKRVNAAVPITA